jgi:methyl-accepting chemotaxis protein
MALLLGSVELAAASFAGLARQTQAATTAHRLSAAVAAAYVQWTLDDDQSNLYAAVKALRDPARQSLAETTYQQAVQARAAVTPALATARTLAATDQERQLLDRIQADLASYDGYTRLLRQQALAGHIQRAVHVVTVKNLVPSNDLPLAFAALEQQANAAVTAASAAGAASGTRLLTILAVVGLLSLLPTIVIARAIAQPLRRLTRAAARLAVGDTAVVDLLPAATADEPGRLATAFRAMVAHQQEVAAATAVAGGDLTVAVAPKDAADTLGHAIATMVDNLGALVLQVTATAGRVGTQTKQLAEVSGQIDQASGQIAQAIEEVARG